MRNSWVLLKVKRKNRQVNQAAFRDTHHGAVALIGDATVIEKTGRVHFVADLAEEYGFTDVDGRRILRFNPLK